MTQDEYTALVKETEGHTPGPWAVSDKVDVYADCASLDHVATCYNGETDIHLDRREADARLIAAAPALLAEVGRLREALSKYADPGIYAPHPHGPAFDDRDLSWIALGALRGDAP